MRGHFHNDPKTILANTPSAGKRVRQNQTRRLHNTGLRSRFRTYIKRVLKAVAAGEREKAQAAYREAVPVIDAGVGKGLLHKNKAARHKRHLNARIRGM